MPLTTITAWELLFDRLGVRPAKPADAGCFDDAGAAGGVGSILIQLARRLTGLKVIAASSRAETRQWCLDLWTHHLDRTENATHERPQIAIPGAQASA